MPSKTPLKQLNLKIVIISYQTIAYKFYSFDVTLLLTNVPLNRNVKTTLQAIYNDKVFPITVRTLKIKGIISKACTKTVFSFNKKFEQLNVYGFTDRSCFGQYRNE